MTDHDDLEARVTALEEQALHTRHDVAAARILAGGADRDVADFKQKLIGHTKVLNALRETQLEHGQRLDTVEREVREGFAETKADIADVKAEVTETKVDVANIKNTLTTVNIGMGQIATLLQRVIDKD
jgi:hypothetical protein